MVIDRFWVDVIGYAALGMSLTSFLFKDERKTKQTIAGGQFLLALHYGFLSAWTSAAMAAVLMCRSFASSFTKTMNQRHIVFIATFFALLLFTAFTWHGKSSLLPLIGSTLASIALCYCSNKLMRVMFLCGSFFWFVNAYVWDSTPLMLAEIAKSSFNGWSLYSIFRDEQKAKLAGVGQESTEQRQDKTVE